MTVEEFVINEENLAQVVKYSLCWKRTHPGSDKRYPYIKYPGGNRGHLKLPEILWTMVRSGMVSAAKVLKTYYSGY